MSPELVLLFGSIIIAVFAVSSFWAGVDLVKYFLYKKTLQKKVSYIMEQSDSMLLAGSERGLFKREAQELDLVQTLMARINYGFLLHIKGLIRFIELEKKFTVKQFVTYSFVSPLLLYFVIKLFLPSLAIFAIFAVAGPYIYLLYLKDQKIKRFVSFFPAALEAMSNNLKAGADIVRSIQAVADDEDNFFAKDFKHILSEIELGVAIPDAFKNYAEKVNITEVDLFAMGIAMSMKSGTNLATFFIQIGDMIRRRIELKGKVNIATSESRFSMLVVLALPVLASSMMAVFDASRYTTFLQSDMGKTLIYASIAVITFAFLIANRIMKIDEDL